MGNRDVRSSKLIFCVRITSRTPGYAACTVDFDAGRLAAVLFDINVRISNEYINVLIRVSEEETKQHASYR